MNTKLAGNTLIIRLKPGDEILESIGAACRENGIVCGYVTGIGASDDAVVGCFSREKKDYTDREYTGDMEICSLVGNITQKDGAIFPHIHITLAREDGVIVGGHLKRAVISLTAEIFISSTDCVINRKYCKNTGIYVFDI